ncbi:helix-turn-helix domain-containing protein [Pseudomonas sp. R76]|uniref:helix-turn-helix domain-containing protein n=1 Tax=Pseudomonas sp. R76 TaxID=1573711 RepID=UPI00131FB8ED|nr:helix-turn-helix transcriptional regulator [Pseudomonas sp. R76]QHD06807.1 hypothetical protein PspR76_14200 [Pseudomonas sp. R76]
MDTPSTAGQHLRQLRRHAKLSQLDLALITGVSQRHLSCLETGRAKPSPRTLHKLLTALEAPLERLLARLPIPSSTELPDAMPPLVLTRIRSTRGELSFLSTFTTFGMPQDITLTSLRIEHLIPADAPTWQVMRAAYADYAALVL